MRTAWLAAAVLASFLVAGPAREGRAGGAAKRRKLTPPEVHAVLGDQTGAGPDVDTFVVHGTAGGTITMSIAPEKGVKPRGTIEARYRLVGGPEGSGGSWVGKPKRRGRFRLTVDGDYEVRISQTGTSPFAGGYVLTAATKPLPHARLRPQADVEGTLLISARAGVVRMPSGVQVSPQTCKVTNWMQEVTPANDGSYALDTFDGESTVAIVTSASGAPMLVGWQGAGWGEISARTTADFLVFLSVMGPLVPGDGRERLRRAIAQLPEVDTLAHAIELSLAADPESMGKSNPAVSQALHDVVTLLLPAPPGKTKSLLVEPADARSGLKLNTDKGINSIYFRQSYRRRAFAYVDRVAYVPKDGDEPVRLKKPVRVAAFGIDPVGGVKDTVGAFSDIVSALAANTEMPYAEKDCPGEPLGLAFEPADAKKVIYQVIVTGPGEGEGDWSSPLLTKEHRDKHLEVALQSLILDMVLPMVVAWFGTEPGGDLLKLDEKAIGGFVADAISIFSQAAPGAVEKAKQGDLEGALRDLLNAFFTSNTLQDEFVSACFEAKILSYARKSGVPASEAIGKSLALGKIAKQCANGLNWANAALTAFDTVAIGVCLAKSNAADIWSVSVLPSKVQLLPESSKVDRGGEVQLRCVVQELAGSGAHLEYRWSTKAAHGHVTDGLPGHEDTFTSSHDTVTYTSDGKSKGTDTITVKAYQMSGAAQSGRTYLGEATATVEVGDGFTYRLYGEAAGQRIGVDDGLDVYLNGALVYSDGAAPAGNRSPIQLSAKAGDTLRLVVRDTYGYCASMSKVLLRLPTGKSVVVDEGFSTGCGRPSTDLGVVHDKTFKIPKTGK